tara:strand:+ start:49 stop:1065 length:1017 start_codon:yes stop_codon:yes gene_type:complete
MFFVGLSALLLRFVSVFGEITTLNEVELPENKVGGDSVNDSDTLISQLEEMPRRLRKGYMWRRLHAALCAVKRNGTADNLDAQLRNLAEDDLDSQQEGYGLARIIIWATPMLGFLGTVIGITAALGDMATQQLGDDLQGAMQGLLSGLYVAFDTTALALTLSIGLMFTQFLVDRVDSHLLSCVSVNCLDQLGSRFATESSNETAELSSDDIAAALSESQGKLFASAMQHVQENWEEWIASTGSDMRDVVVAASQGLVDSQQVVLQQLVDHQSQMHKTVEATSDVIRLETALNNNLRLLSEAGHFEQAVMSLSAAVQLLAARTNAVESPEFHNGQDRAA